MKNDLASFGQHDRVGSTELLVFCSVAFIATYLMEGWLWFSGGLGNEFALIFLLVVMFIPLISAVVTVKLVTKGSLRSYGIAKGTIRHYLCALAYPFVVIALGLVFLAITKSAPIDFTLTKYKEFFPNVRLPDQVPLFLTIVNLALAPFINFIPAFGEEYGWRGFLLPKLIQKFGVLGGFLVTGTIWGLWHAPVILMGYNYPHHADLIGVVAFTVWAILVGFFLGWLRLKSKSTFPAALGHGAINAYLGLGLLIAPAADEMRTIPFGAAGLLALLIIAAVAYTDLRKSFSHT